MENGKKYKSILFEYLQKRQQSESFSKSLSMTSSMNIPANRPEFQYIFHLDNSVLSFIQSPDRVIKGEVCQQKKLAEESLCKVLWEMIPKDRLADQAQQVAKANKIMPRLQNIFAKRGLKFLASSDIVVNLTGSSFNPSFQAVLDIPDDRLEFADYFGLHASKKFPIFGAIKSNHREAKDDVCEKLLQVLEEYDALPESEDIRFLRRVKNRSSPTSIIFIPNTININDLVGDKMEISITDSVIGNGVDIAANNDSTSSVDASKRQSIYIDYTSQKDKIQNFLSKISITNIDIQFMELLQIVGSFWEIFIRKCLLRSWHATSSDVAGVMVILEIEFSPETYHDLQHGSRALGEDGHYHGSV